MPVNANFYYKTAKDASYITLRNQNKMLYANYVIQQNNVQQGCQLRVELQNGGVADADIIPKLLEGARETTVEERAAEIASEACPVTAVNPYLSDKIYLSLTTSAASYEAAPVGTWVTITSTEYTALQTNVTSTSLVGSDAATFSAMTSLAFTTADFAAANINSTYSPTLAANTYLFAFAVRIKTPVTTTLDNLRVYANTSTSVYSGFRMVGSAPVPAAVAGVNYYVYKGQNAVNAATDGLLAITAPGNATASLSQSYHILYGTTLNAAVQFKYANSVSLPLASGTTLSSTASAGWGFGIQGLATNSIQWVTS